MRTELRVLIKRIIDLCLDKDLYFSHNPNVKLISIWNFDKGFECNAYYDGEMKGYNEGNYTTIDNMLNKIQILLLVFFLVVQKPV